MIIDVSQFQGIPDFHALKRHGVTAVYIKATEGQTFVSPTLREQWAKAGEAKLLRGTYHFARQDAHPSLKMEVRELALNLLPLGDGHMGSNHGAPEGSPSYETPGEVPADRAAHGAQDEARHYVHTMRTLPGRKGDAWHKGELRPVLDFEVGTADHHYSPWRDEFFHTIHALTRHSTVLYTFPAFNSWSKPPRFAAQLWIADFRGRTSPGLPEGYKAYNLWQYTSRGQVPPIHGFVDLSRLAPKRSIASLRCAVNG